jgi:pyruvate formate lyase activating enzyme
MESGVNYELRTTVVDELHEVQDFDEIGKWIKGARRYFLQCFTDRDTVPFGGLSAPSTEKLSACAERVRAYVQDVQIRGVE